jgi:hypothetical protein
VLEVQASLSLVALAVRDKYSVIANSGANRASLASVTTGTEIVDSDNVKEDVAVVEPLVSVTVKV